MNDDDEGSEVWNNSDCFYFVFWLEEFVVMIEDLRWSCFPMYTGRR